MDLDHVSNTGYSADNYSEVEPLKNAKQWREVVGKHPCYDPVRHLVIPSLKNPNHYAFSPLLGFPPMKRDILFYARWGEWEEGLGFIRMGAGREEGKGRGMFIAEKGVFVGGKRTRIE